MANLTQSLQGGLGGAGAGAAIGTALGGPGIGTALGAIAGALPGLLSSDNSEQIAAIEAQRKEAQQKALEAIMAIPDPTLRQVQYEKLVQQGVLRPEEEQAITQGPSELKQISLDPKLRAIQLEALANMQALGKASFTPEERLALEQSRLQQVRDLQAQQQGILQNRQQRGLAGGGDELAAQLQGAQAGAQLASQSGMQLASLAQQRALNAMTQGSSMAKGMEASDYDRAAAAARAQDELNRFNVNQQAAVQQRNIYARNAAQEQNLSQAQAIANANAQNAYNAQVQNANLATNYQNALQAKGKALAEAQSGQASSLGKQEGQVREDVATQGQNLQNLMGKGFQAGTQVAQNIAGADEATQMKDLAAKKRRLELMQTQQQLDAQEAAQNKNQQNMSNAYNAAKGLV